MKIISVLGTRPNFIKVAPLNRALEKYKDTVKHLICHTGQHSDTTMSDVFFKDLGLPAPDFYMGVNNGSHGEITGRIIIEFEKILVSEKPDLVIVVGDVNSTMACAIATVKLNIKVAHVEAGLRSGDRTMPEEINRIITDSIADYLFVTEKAGIENLARESVDSSKVFFTGNVMIDSMVYLSDKVDKSLILDHLGLQRDKYILVTFHRPSNVDSHDGLKSIIDFLNEISVKAPVVFPVHPRTMKNLEKFNLNVGINPNVRFIEPQGYIDFQHLIKHAKMVVTDSGGIQEETTYLGVQCITVRENTERPVTVELGTNQLCGVDMLSVKKKVFEVLSGITKSGIIPPLWDGKAAVRIIDSLLKK